jgi:hypothetical protein
MDVRFTANSGHAECILQENLFLRVLMGGNNDQIDRYCCFCLSRCNVESASTRILHEKLNPGPKKCRTRHYAIVTSAKAMRLKNPAASS